MQSCTSIYKGKYELKEEIIFEKKDATIRNFRIVQTEGHDKSHVIQSIIIFKYLSEQKMRSLEHIVSAYLDLFLIADDSIIMVGSEMSANRVMRNISRFIEGKLGHKVNMIKSRVDKPKGLKYLGFGFYYDRPAHQYKAKPHAKSVAKFKKRMKELTCRSWGVSNGYKVEKLNQLIRGVD